MKVRRIRKSLNISLKEMSNHLGMPVIRYEYYELFGVGKMECYKYYKMIELFVSKRK